MAELYETAEKLIRFIMTELPKDRFTQFLDAVLGGRTSRRRCSTFIRTSLPPTTTSRKSSRSSASNHARPAEKPKPPPAGAKNAAVRVVAGSDEAEVKRRAAELAEEMAGPDAGEFGRDVIDGMADNADQAAGRIHETRQALLTLPFFGGEKLVWLKNANFLADTILGRSAAVAEALEHLQETLTEGLPGGVKFLLSAIDLDKRRTFYKALGKAGEIEVFDKVDSSRGGWEEAAGSMIETRARGARAADGSGRGGIAGDADRRRFAPGG